MRLPDFSGCQALLLKYRVPDHIAAHSREVARLSYCLGEALNALGYNFPLRLLLAAGLLHDIAKMETIASGGDHAWLGGEWLDNEGFPEIAEIVRQHVRLKTDLEAAINARELVFYADKRVRHVELVSIGERLEDLRGRYGVDDFSRQRIEQLGHLTREVERKIFSPLDFTPAELPSRRRKKILTSWIEGNI